MSKAIKCLSLCSEDDSSYMDTDEDDYLHFQETILRLSASASHRVLALVLWNLHFKGSRRWGWVTTRVPVRRYTCWGRSWASDNDRYGFSTPSKLAVQEHS